MCNVRECIGHGLMHLNEVDGSGSLSLARCTGEAVTAQAPLTASGLMGASGMRPAMVPCLGASCGGPAVFGFIQGLMQGAPAG